LEDQGALLHERVRLRRARIPSPRVLDPVQLLGQVALARIGVIRGGLPQQTVRPDERERAPVAHPLDDLVDDAAQRLGLVAADGDDAGASASAHARLRRQAAFGTVRGPMDARITPEIVRQHGLTEDEYRRIVGHIGRDPNLVELGIFSAMWSEHCSYKSSRRFLKHLPTKGPRVLQGPGENAGVVDVGGGLAVAFKMESHNHPSYIEPYQGAATGVGGILR